MNAELIVLKQMAAHAAALRRHSTTDVAAVALDEEQRLQRRIQKLETEERTQERPTPDPVPVAA